MTVAIVGTPSVIVEGGSYTAEAGSARKVVLAFGAEEFNSVTIAPTMGAQAFTEVSGSFIEGSYISFFKFSSGHVFIIN